MTTRMTTHPRRTARRVRALARRQDDIEQYKTGDLTNVALRPGGVRDAEHSIKVAQRDVTNLKKKLPSW